MKKETTSILVKDELVNMTLGKWETGTNDDNGETVIRSDDGRILTNLECDRYHLSDKEIADNAKAICTAVNNTYGKGYDPAAIEELYKALTDLAERAIRCRGILQNTNSENKGYWGILDTETAKTALTNAKL